MSIQRAIFIKLSGAEPYAGGDWNEYHESPIYIDTNKTGIIIRDDFNVSGDAYFDSGSYFSGHLYQHQDYNSYLSGKLFVNKTGYVSGDLNILKDLDVSGAVDISGEVSITGSTRIENDLNVSGDLDITGNSYLQSNLYLNQTGYITGDLNILKKLHLSGEGNFYSAPKVHDDLYVSGDSILSGNKYISGQLNVLNKAHVSGDLVVEQTGYVERDLFVGGDLFVSGEKTIINTSELVIEDKNIQLAWSSGDVGKFSRGQLDGAGITIVATGEGNSTEDILFVYDEGYDALNSNVNVFVSEDLFVEKTGHINNLVASGYSLFKDNIRLNKTGYFEDDVFLSTGYAKDIVISGTGHNQELIVSGNSLFKDDVFVETTGYISGDLEVTGDVRVTGDVYISGNLEFNHVTIPGNLYIKDKLYAESGVVSSGDFILSKTGYVSGDFNVKDVLKVSGSGDIEELFVNTGKINDIEVSGGAAFDDVVKIHETGYVGKLLEVSGVSNFKNNLYLDKTGYISGDLDISGTGYITGDLNVTGNVNVTGDVVVGGTFIPLTHQSVPGNFYIGDKLYAKSGINSSGHLLSEGQITGQQGLVVSGYSYFGNIDSTGSVNLSGDVTVTGDLDLSGNSTLTGDLTHTGRVNRSGVTDHRGDLNLSGNLDITGDVFIDGNIYNTGNNFILDTTTLRVYDKNIELATGSGYGNLRRNELDGAGITIKASGDNNDIELLYKNSDVALHTNVSFLASGDVTTKQTGYIYEDLNVGKNLDVSGDSNLKKNLFLDQTGYILGDLNILKDLDVSGNVDISGETTITGATRIEDKLDVSGTLDVTGKTFLQSDLHVGQTGYITGDFNILGLTNITGATKIENHLDISGTLDVTGKSFLHSDLHVGQTGYITGDLNVSGSGRYGGDVLLENSQSGLAVSAIAGVGTGIRVNDWIVDHTVIQTDINNKSFTEQLINGPLASNIISMNATVFRNNDSIAYSVYSVANPSQDPDGPGYNFEISYSGNTVKVVDLDDALRIADEVTIDIRYKS